MLDLILSDACFPTNKKSATFDISQTVLFRSVGILHALRAVDFVFQHLVLSRVIARSATVTLAVLRLIPVFLRISFAMISVVFYIFAILGMELFAEEDEYTWNPHNPSRSCSRCSDVGYFADVPNNRFCDFPAAFLTLLQMLISNDWPSIMYRAADQKGFIYSAYFISFMVLAGILLLNLFTAAFLDVFTINQDTLREPVDLYTMLAEEEEESTVEFMYPPDSALLLLRDYSNKSNKGRVRRDRMKQNSQRQIENFYQSVMMTGTYDDTVERISCFGGDYNGIINFSRSEALSVMVNPTRFSHMQLVRRLVKIYERTERLRDSGTEVKSQDVDSVQRRSSMYSDIFARATRSTSKPSLTHSPSESLIEAQNVAHASVSNLFHKSRRLRTNRLSVYAANIAPTEVSQASSAEPQGEAVIQAMLRNDPEMTKDAQVAALQDALRILRAQNETTRRPKAYRWE